MYYPDICLEELTKTIQNNIHQYKDNGDRLLRHVYLLSLGSKYGYNPTLTT
jgi:hypothetical protein